MSLDEMEREGELEPLAHSAEELDQLMTMARRRLKDAQIAENSAETRLVSAYQVILGCAIAGVRKNDYRVSNATNKHFVTINTLRFTVGLTTAEVNYCQGLRRKRNQDNYEGNFFCSEQEAAEAVAMAARLLEIAERCL